MVYKKYFCRFFRVEQVVYHGTVLKVKKREIIKLVRKKHQKMPSFMSFYQILEVDTAIKTAQREEANDEK